MVATANRIAGGAIVVWDASTGELLFTEEAEGLGRWRADLIFTPDSQHVILASDWGATRDGTRVISTDTCDVVDHIGQHSGPGQQVPALVGYVADGSMLLGITGLAGTGRETELHWYDAETLELVRVQRNVHEGSLKDMALSPARQVQGVAFMNDHHLVVSARRSRSCAADHRSDRGCHVQVIVATSGRSGLTTTGSRLSASGGPVCGSTQTASCSSVYTTP